MATCPTSTTTNLTGGETTALSQIKLICCRRKKGTKRHMYLTFIESRSIDSLDEVPSIEIRTKNGQTTILLDDCIALEYFDVIKNNFQSVISFYYPSLTISIYFSDEDLTKKETIVKHLKSMFDVSHDQNYSTSDEIFHTFDAKLIPSAPIVARDHQLLGPVRLFFTMTDLYIVPFETTSTDLKTVMNKPNSLKEKMIFSIPYFTIKHYGNRGRIFLVELGKSKYGDGEIRVKCSTSALASTIHLFASPIIEERPWVLSSAFANQFITDKRRAKLQQSHPPIPFHHDVSKGPIIDLSLPFLEKNETPVESRPLSPVKSRSFVNTFRKFVKHVSPLQRSATFDAVIPTVTPSTTSQACVPTPSINRTEPEISPNSYVDMGPAKKVKLDEVREEDEDEEEEEEEDKREEKRMIDVGVNTIISISPQIRSAIIVGNSVHLINEEKEVFPIGQRSFTSPASVLQPFRSQLGGQVTVNNYAMPSDLNTRAPISSSSFHQPSSTATSRQNLFVTYDVLTFNSATQIDSNSSELSFSDQPTTIYSMEKILSSSSSNSQLLRTLSFSTKNVDDNLSGSILTSRGSIIFFDDQTSTYLFDTPVKQADRTNLDEIEKKIPSKSFLEPSLQFKSSDVNSMNSEDQCSVSLSTSTDVTENESDPNRIPPFIL